MKCMPTTSSGRLVDAAILVMDMEDVLLAKMQPAGAASSICLKIFSFSSTFSVAASTTNSAWATPLLISVVVVKLFNACCFCPSVMEPLAICLSKFLLMVATALSNCAAFTSINVTAKPLCANMCAMPLPIVPAPITAIFFMNCFLNGELKSLGMLCSKCNPQK